MNDERAHELLEFQITKDIGYLYKNCLGIMEGVRNDHCFMMEKLYAAIPEEYHSIIKAADHFDDNQFGFIRKKILDAGNNAIRATDIQVKKFDVEFKSSKAQG